ncbi:MAG TPA: thiamine diphosphokinase [Spirochaetales bacterium]|nr:thiamine diphosphokinase [Spirochaetales bacterium]
MEALLVVGGEAPPQRRLASRFASFGLVCAADSGLDTLAAWGRSPDLVVGDMDSLSDLRLLDAYPEAEILRARRDKDETDTELGLAALAARGATRIVLAGGGGGRLDHLLAIRAIFERDGSGGRPRPSEWHTANAELRLVEAGAALRLSAPHGSMVSVFPLARGARGMGSVGLRWPLDGLDWGPGDFGVSNEAPAGEFTVSAGEGELLVLIGT